MPIWRVARSTISSASRLSPVLWRKLPGARSAGRVQSVALRLVCDRENEIETFKRREYWSLVARLATPRGDEFEARLVGADGKKIARLDVGTAAGGGGLPQGARRRALHGRRCRIEAGQAPSLRAVHHLDAAAGGEPQARLRAEPHHADRAAALRGRRHRRRDRRPHHLYANRRRRHGAGGGRGAVRGVIGEDFSARHLPGVPRRYQVKAKNAQEAHEAIRPTDPPPSARGGAHARSRTRPSSTS